ncbi:putative cell wall biosynthesis related protein [Maribacter sp. HTCC2170]|nr:putative cell wall biosynthesis related protein [Maribacter sp. HTCC2170]
MELDSIFDKICINHRLVTFNKIISALLFTCFSVLTLISQEVQSTVIAKSGDGIFSLLRNEGIEIAKYYEEFIKLNEDNIKNGSHLIVGQEYKIPFAPDSFKNSGVRLQFPDENEEAIFKNELASLKRIDSTMRNTVYYLITNSGDSNNVQNEIAERMARKLLQRNARVYLMNFKRSDSLDLLDLTSVINKKFLKHKGHYQRVLVLNTKGLASSSNTNVTVYHNAKSKEGRELADNLLMVIGKNRIKQKSLDEYVGVFKDFESVSFAKNLLPTLTFVEMGKKSNSDTKSLKVSSNKKNIANLLTNGILLDYSKLDFEEN